MFVKLFTSIFGTKHDRDLKKIWPIVTEINEHFESYNKLSDEQLQAKTEEFKSVCPVSAVCLFKVIPVVRQFQRTMGE